jgi:hypothetical protein
MRTLTDTWAVNLPKDVQFEGATHSLNCWLGIFSAEHAAVALERRPDDGRLTVSATLFARAADSRRDVLRLKLARRRKAFFVRRMSRLHDENDGDFERRWRTVVANEPGASLTGTATAESDGETLYLLLFRRPLTRWELSKRKSVKNL